MARILVVDDSPTIRKVVTGILERHGYETIAAVDGQTALDALQSDDSKIDLVLLDFVMPKMNGFQFCRAVRRNERWNGLPVVLMSAKSDKIRDQFVEQTGAIDAISKPFDAQALVVAIENALRRMNQGRLSQGRLPDMEDVEALPTSTKSLPGLDAEQMRMRAAMQVGARVGAAVAPLLAKLPPGASGDRAQIASAIANGMSFDTMRELMRALRDVDVGEGTLALSGDIGVIPIGAVLQMLQVEAQTGLITVSNGKSEVTITMRAGLIDLVQSRGAGDEFRLGRFFVEEGLVTPEEIDGLLKDHPRPRERSLEVEGSRMLTDDVSAPARPSQDRISANGDRISASGERSALTGERVSGAGERRSSVPPHGTPRDGVRAPRMLLGDVLVQSGRVSAEQLRSALARQSSELVYEVLRWPRGQFEFRAQPSHALALKAQLGLPVASVVMEGFRRVDEWRLVEAGLGSFESVLVRDPMAIETLPLQGGIEATVSGGLSRQERVVLGAIDGERTVREIIAASHMSSFDACRILMQFLEARLVRRRQG